MSAVRTSDAYIFNQRAVADRRDLPRHQSALDSELVELGRDQAGLSGENMSFYFPLNPDLGSRDVVFRCADVWRARTRPMPVINLSRTNCDDFVTALQFRCLNATG